MQTKDEVLRRDVIKLIRVIKQNPLIYEGRGTLAHREAIWEEIANFLEDSVENIRTRWYIIRQCYQRELLAGGEITYGDELEFLRPHLPPAEKPTPNLGKKNDRPEFCISAEDLKNIKDTKKYDFVEINTEELRDSTNSYIAIKNSPPDSPRYSDIEVIHMGDSDEQHFGANNRLPSKSSQARSEDDIFGEWVAAMLKSTIDEDKKRRLKKEIMNMLLS